MKDFYLPTLTSLSKHYTSEFHHIVIGHLLIVPKEFMWEMRKTERFISNSDERLRSEKFGNTGAAKVL